MFSKFDDHLLYKLAFRQTFSDEFDETPKSASRSESMQLTQLSKESDFNSIEIQ